MFENWRKTYPKVIPNSAEFRMDWTTLATYNIPFIFDCRTGVIGCSPDEIIPYGDCADNCREDPSQYEKCLKLCESAPNCVNVSNLNLCNAIFLCHNGGDTLDISELKLFFNDNEGTSSFKRYNELSEMPEDIENGEFSAGQVLWYPITTSPQKVMISYNDISSGQNFILASKKFR